MKLYYNFYTNSLKLLISKIKKVIHNKLCLDTLHVTLSVSDVLYKFPYPKLWIWKIDNTWFK